AAPCFAFAAESFPVPVSRLDGSILDSPLRLLGQHANANIHGGRIRARHHAFTVEQLPITIEQRLAAPPIKSLGYGATPTCHRLLGTGELPDQIMPKLD